jgi:hypothetical protein
MLGYNFSISLTSPGILPAAFGGAPVVEKKFPRAAPFSGVSGGYLFVDHSQLYMPGLKEWEKGYWGIEPGDVRGLVVKEIRHEDLVRMILIRGSKDICALEGLRKVSEDVEHNKDRPGSIGWASDVFEPTVSQSTR